MASKVRCIKHKKKKKWNDASKRWITDLALGIVILKGCAVIDSSK